MKSKLFFLSLVLCGSIYAETIATMRNRAGGLIILTDVSTERCKAFAGVAYTTTEDNRSTWGCWFSDELMVHIRWPDGDPRAYPIENFTIDYDAAKRLRERIKGKKYDL